MSEIDKATKRLNDAADKATITTNFFDELTTAGKRSDVTNPNNNKKVPSVSKQVMQVYEEEGLNPDAISRQNQQLIRNLGEWQAGLTFEKKGDYATFNDQAIVTNDDTPLPYTAQGADPTVAPDASNVVPFAEVTQSELEKYTIFTGSEAELQSVIDPKVGQQVEVNGTTYTYNGAEWIATSIPLAQSLGATCDGVTDDSTALSAISQPFRVDGCDIAIKSNTSISQKVHIGPGVRFLVDLGVELTFNNLVYTNDKFTFLDSGGRVKFSKVTVNVPADYPTVQSAINDCPRNLLQYYTIEISDGVYDEDLFIDSVRAAKNNPYFDAEAPSTDEGEHGRLYIQSASGDRDLCSVKSVAAAGCMGGQTPLINNLTLTDKSPVDTENASIVAYGSGSYVTVRNVKFAATNANLCILSYGSFVEYTGCDFGNAIYDQALKVKHGGVIKELPYQNSSSGVVKYLSGGNGDISLWSSPQTVGYTATTDRSREYSHIATAQNGSGGNLTHDSLTGVAHGVSFLSPGSALPDEFRDSGISLDGYNRTTPNNGEVTFDIPRNGYKIVCSSTAGDRTVMKKPVSQSIGMRSAGNDGYMTFYAYHEAAFSVYAQHLNDAADFYVGSGDLDRYFIGFRITNGEARGYVFDTVNGVEEVVLDTPLFSVDPLSNDMVLRYVSMPKGQKVRFYIQDRLAGEITGLQIHRPQATCDNRVYYAVESVGTQRIMFIRDAMHRAVYINFEESYY